MLILTKLGDPGYQESLIPSSFNPWSKGRIPASGLSSFQPLKDAVPRILIWLPYLLQRHSPK